jgi:Holliday junction resolvase
MVMTVTCRSKINSRAKGARFERTLASKLREYGYDCRRGQQFCGANGDADVIGLPHIHIEAKAQEQMRLYEWMSQAKRDSEGTGKLPAVFHKKNNCEILVTMRLDDWMNLYREFEAGFDFKEENNETT